MNKEASNPSLSAGNYQLNKTINRVTFGKNVNFNHRPGQVSLLLSKSAETIYRNAVEERISSSSKEGIDTSDENLDFLVDEDFQPDYNDVP